MVKVKFISSVNSDSTALSGIIHLQYAMRKQIFIC